MKALVYTFLVFLLAIPLRAQSGDNWIQNGDFADGINHWYGGGRSPADFANDNPLSSNDPLTSKGLIIPLRPGSWTKVAQDFKGKVSDGILTITFKVSKDFAFSTKPEDYVNMTDKIGYDGWKALNSPPGSWMLLLTDFGSHKGFTAPIAPKPGIGDVQTWRAGIKGMTPFENKTITLAFPPGNGTLVVLGVSLTSAP
jgi:hypothetical protein